MCDCEVGNGKKAYMTRESKKKSILPHCGHGEFI